MLVLIASALQKLKKCIIVITQWPLMIPYKDQMGQVQFWHWLFLSRCFLFFSLSLPPVLLQGKWSETLIQNDFYEITRIQVIKLYMKTKFGSQAREKGAWSQYTFQEYSTSCEGLKKSCLTLEPLPTHPFGGLPLCPLYLEG